MVFKNLTRMSIQGEVCSVGEYIVIDVFQQTPVDPDVNIDFTEEFILDPSNTSFPVVGTLVSAEVYGLNIYFGKRISCRTIKSFMPIPSPI